MIKARNYEAFVSGPSLQSRFYRWNLKRGAKRSGPAPHDVEARRSALEASARKIPLPPKISLKNAVADGVAVEWITHAGAGDEVILYLHGGGYVVGSRRTHRSLAARIGLAARARVLQVEYRLAPEHPFPAALEDVHKVYSWLLHECGVNNRRVAIVGDSAGGGLALAATMHIRDQGEPLPASVVCLSPWTDLTLSGESYDTRMQVDPVFSSVDGLKLGVDMVAGDVDPRHHYLSPLFGEFKGLPPLYIQVGDHEILLSDSFEAADKAAKAGVEVRFEVWKFMWHGWQLKTFMPESRKAVAEAGSFLRKHWPKSN